MRLAKVRGREARRFSWLNARLQIKSYSQRTPHSVVLVRCFGVLAAPLHFFSSASRSAYIDEGINIS